jgi:hypothetical protein
VRFANSRQKTWAVVGIRGGTRNAPVTQLARQGGGYAGGIREFYRRNVSESVLSVVRELDLLSKFVIGGLFSAFILV